MYIYIYGTILGIYLKTFYNTYTVAYTIYIYDARIKDSSRSVDNHPLRQVTYEPGRAAVKQVGKRRVHRPRQNWAYSINELIHSRSSLSDYTECQNQSILDVARRWLI